MHRPDVPATCTCRSCSTPVGLVGFLQRQFGLPIASTAPLAPITDAFGAAMHRFARDNGMPWVDFAKGQRKDDVMHEHLAGFTGDGGGAVHRAGAGEDHAVPHREAPRPRRRSYPWIVDHHRGGQPVLLLLRRRRLRPVLHQVLLLLPVQRQAVHQRPRVGQTAGRQGRDRVHRAGQRVRRRRRPGAALQAICDRLGPEQIDALLRKWLARLPHPFTAADRAAGYRYDISILQAEFSLTQMLDRPVSGRVFFEQVIRDNLDIGRPDQVA